MPLIAVADAPAGEPLEAADGPGGAVRGRRARAGADALHLGHDRAAEGRARARTAPSARRRSRNSCSCELRPGDRTLGVMPLYHTMGMRSLLAASACGGLFCSQPEFRADAALDAVERERLTSLYLAPTLFHDLVAAQRERPRDVSSVRALAYAGAPMSGVLVERCVEAFAPEAFVNHYGSTEIYTFTIHGDQRAKPGCAGRAGAERAHPPRRARARARRPTDVVAPGEVGQVACALSSDEAFSGYWKRPDADARQIRDGWYFPGDLGQLDADGDLYLVGRIDDMIVSGGENVHPLEIEEWLVRHPGVDEAAVVGEEDERLGQRVVAYVVCAGEVTPDALDAHCLASPTLARFKRPTRLPFRRRAAEERVGQALAPPAAHDRGNHMTEYDGFRVARENDRGVATITLDVPEQVQPREHGRARRARPGVRRARRRRRRARRRPARCGRPGLHGGRGRRHVHGARRRGALAPARQRRRARALPEARDRAAARLLLRRRPRARAGVRLPRGERRRPARAARAHARDDPRLGRGLAARQDDRRLAHQGRRHARPPRLGGRGAGLGAALRGRARATTWAPPSRAWPTSSRRARRSRCARPSA